MKILLVILFKVFTHQKLVLSIIQQTKLLILFQKHLKVIVFEKRERVIQPNFRNY